MSQRTEAAYGAFVTAVMKEFRRRGRLQAKDAKNQMIPTVEIDEKQREHNTQSTVQIQTSNVRFSLQLCSRKINGK